MVGGFSAFMKGVPQKLAERCGRRLLKRDEIDVLTPLLARRLDRTDRFFFVQIGGNDGRSFDPIYSFVTRHHERLAGLILEPMRGVFAELEHNYRHCPSVTCINKAIHNTKDEMLLHRVDPAKAETLPDWAKGIASFDPEHHKKSGIPSDCMITESVPCISFGRLAADYAIEKIDLLQIDTEGYDAEIVMSIDFESIRPAIIHFEHGLAEGIMDRRTFGRLSDRLHQYGYHVVVEPYDATAYQLEAVHCFEPALRAG